VAEPSGFSNVISILAGADAFTLLLPFLLSWMLYLAMIERAGIFDNSSSLENASPVVALILAFFTARFLVAQPFYQTFFSDFFGRVVIGLASLLGLYTLLAFSGWDLNSKDSDVDGYVKYVGAMMAGAAFIWAGGFGPQIFGASEAGGALGSIIGAISGFFNTLVQTGAIWAIPVLVAMWFIYDSGGNGGSS